nr:MAG TPA: hypothetical protein [Caudoviricetes sp.]DAZ75655.1 MAG TPA: hypothetical protein [Caudoviricetes sp.]
MYLELLVYIFVVHYIVLLFQYIASKLVRL